MHTNSKLTSSIISLTKGLVTMTIVALVSFCLVSCSFFLSYEHRSHTLYQADILFEDNKNNLYFDVGTGTIVFCKYSNVEKLHYIDYDYSLFWEGENALNYEFSVSNEDYLFVCLRSSKTKLTPSGFVDSPRFIKIFDKDFNEIKAIHFADDETILDVSCTDDYLYILLNNETLGTRVFKRYNLSLDSLTVLKTNVCENDCYEDEDICLFFKEYSRSNYKRYIGKYTQKTRLLGNGNNYYTDRISLTLLDDCLVLNCLGEERRFKKRLDFNNLYKKVYLIDNEIVFAAYNYEDTSLCVNSRSTSPCICALGESFLFKYKIETNDLMMINRFDSGSFLIDYDLENVEYYHQGYLYVNNDTVRQCEKIEPKKLNRGDNYTHEEHYYLSYYNGQFYGV